MRKRTDRTTIDIDAFIAGAPMSIYIIVPPLHRRMAQDLANLVGSISADDIMNMPPDEQVLLIEGRPLQCRQVRYYEDREFRGPVKS